MHANGNIIPLTEDDQDEGIKDPIDEFDKVAKDIVDLKEPSTPPPPPQPPRMKMKEGMPIVFYGYAYKVVRVRPNGSVVLKFKGEVRK